MRPLIPVAVLAPVLAVVLAGCGSSGGSGHTPSSSTRPAPGSATRPSIAPGQLQKLQQCLKAAGISVPTAVPSGLPSGFKPGQLPSNLPSGFPSNFPSNLPNGGGIGALTNDPKVRAALKACGIALPGTP